MIVAAGTACPVCGQTDKVGKAAALITPDPATQALLGKPGMSTAPANGAVFVFWLAVLLNGLLLVFLQVVLPHCGTSTCSSAGL